MNPPTSTRGRRPYQWVPARNVRAGERRGIVLGEGPFVMCGQNRPGWRFELRNCRALPYDWPQERAEMGRKHWIVALGGVLLANSALAAPITWNNVQNISGPGSTTDSTAPVATGGLGPGS